ncbi:MAG: DUF1669 domain-containing protein [Flavobacteriales bacterium]|nr:DUF1669 domain-containing protein [Flavobacteriales bacterium]
MITQAYFDQIETQLLKELDKAQESILVAVAWLTNAQLFNKLREKCGRGVTVELMIFNDEINNASGNDFSRLEAIGGKLYKVGSGDGGTLMHNKFCVIDRSTVINGSYNWSYKARQNHENITVSTNADELAAQFVAEFRRLKAKYFSEEGGGSEVVDPAKLNHRLALIKNLIKLEELEEMPLQIAKLSNSNSDAALDEIIVSLQERRYANALLAIDAYIQARSQVATYVDPEIVGLRLEARALELQLKALTDEQTDLERLIHQFQIRHAQELGPLILKILLLRKEKAKTAAEREEAENDYQKYQKDYQRQKDEIVHILNEEEKDELKKLYREGSKLCHPDAVQAEHQVEAAKWFIALKDAYEHNDKKKVNEILAKLKKGVAFGSVVDSFSKKERLRDWVEEYRRRVETLLEQIVTIKGGKNYQTVASITDWDIYFTDMKSRLTEELEQLNHGDT